MVAVFVLKDSGVMVVGVLLAGMLSFTNNMVNVFSRLRLRYAGFWRIDSRHDSDIGFLWDIGVFHGVGKVLLNILSKK